MSLWEAAAAPGPSWPLASPERPAHRASRACSCRSPRPGRLTAGWRARFSHVLLFNPTDPASAKYNPLLEVRRGEHEVRDVQNIADILVDPEGLLERRNHWEKTSHSLLVGAILHVLYAEADKTLAGVAAFLSDPGRPIEATLAAMRGYPRAAGFQQMGLTLLHNVSAFTSSGLRRCNDAGAKAVAIVARNTHPNNEDVTRQADAVIGFLTRMSAAVDGVAAALCVRPARRIAVLVLGLARSGGRVAGPRRVFGQRARRRRAGGRRPARVDLARAPEIGAGRAPRVAPRGRALQGRGRAAAVRLPRGLLRRRL